ncbi:MAG: FumA C-terminus/TtdB family hydratase beta subunit [Candidatus Adiutrix sp.]|jgi:fumarate hydratase subunit beta|nr:FumA C-terminus/TtdB family hydratase beta subunit [Candidatus Adiutrix sp.]
MTEISLTTPLTGEIDLAAGTRVLLSGRVYTARDAAHLRLAELLQEGREPPFPFAGQVVFYAGPCPARPGEACGPIGPTTSGRLDALSPLLIERGLKYMIGKGARSPEVAAAVARHKGLYFGAIGGAAALMSRRVTKVELVAFEDLGPEAIHLLTVEDLPLVVALDARGRDIYRRLAANISGPF